MDSHHPTRRNCQILCSRGSSNRNRDFGQEEWGMEMNLDEIY